MCGFFGILNFKENVPVAKNDLEKGINILKHRGPDEIGFYCDGNLGLAHCRLSIIDLESGRQPLSNEDESIWIVFNGEIYNYKELRENLIRNGHKFRTKSDTETIIHLYEDFKEGCLEKLNGIFAFAIFDKRNRKLFLARDRLGVKPLYYAVTEYGIIFASEIKAFLTTDVFKKELNPLAIDDFFSLGYILSPKTIFKEAQSLPAGHCLKLFNNNIRIQKYWDINFNICKSDDLKNIQETISAKIEKAVQMQLVSDVTVGGFLSGGIDSTAVVYFMKKALKNSNVQTFSIGFEEKSYDELRYANYASGFLKTAHEKLVVSEGVNDFLPKIVWHNDEPFGDTSAIPMYFVSQLARKHVKVVLSGDGGDENFGGYETYLADILARYYKGLLPLPVRRIFKSISSLMPVTFHKVSFDYKLKRFTEGAEFEPLTAHHWWRLVFTPEEKKKLYSSGFMENNLGYSSLDVFREHFEQSDAPTLMQKLSYVDYKTWLADDILRKVDRASMAHSLEVRVPLLDHTLVELAASLPDTLKVHRGITKYILKKSMENKLPRKIIWRKKSGFNSPVSHWFRNKLKDITMESLSKQNINSLGFLNGTYIDYLLTQHMSKREDNGLKIWCLLNFILWYKIFMEGNTITQ